MGGPSEVTIRSVSQCPPNHHSPRAKSLVNDGLEDIVINLIVLCCVWFGLGLVSCLRIDVAKSRCAGFTIIFRICEILLKVQSLSIFFQILA